MRPILPIFLFVLLFVACQGQQKQAAKLHPIVAKAKETSLYSANVDWPTVNQRFVKLIESQTTVEGMQSGLEFLINSLGDKHGTFRLAKDHSVIASYTGTLTGMPDRDPNFVNTVINDITATFSYAFLDGNVGYLKIVGIGPNVTVEGESNRIRDGLKALAAQGADKWIVDLRYNGGGNMNPMMAGLAPLIGEGFVGGSVDAQNQLAHEYTIREGQFYDSNRLVCAMDNKPEVGPETKVAVLLSRYTISSGELVAVAFKGRPNTRFIGEPSAGYTTGNGYETVTEDLIMTISEAVYVDRNRKRYDQRVEVDEEMEFGHTLATEGDKQVERAIEWLNQK